MSGPNPFRDCVGGWNRGSDNSQNAVASATVNEISRQLAQLLQQQQHQQAQQQQQHSQNQPMQQHSQQNQNQQHHHHQQAQQQQLQLQQAQSASLQRHHNLQSQQHQIQVHASQQHQHQSQQQQHQLQPQPHHQQQRRTPTSSLLGQSNDKNNVFHQQQNLSSFLQQQHNHGHGHAQRNQSPHQPNGTSLLSASVQNQLASSLRNQALQPLRNAGNTASVTPTQQLSLANRSMLGIQHPHSQHADTASLTAALQQHHAAAAANNPAAPALHSLASQAINFAKGSLTTSTTPNLISAVAAAAAVANAPSHVPLGSGKPHDASVSHFAPTVGATDMKMPCQARGMPADHNSSSAYFVVPANATHGQHLFCSYPSCKAAGVKFRLCKFCMKPVTKQNFRSRHDHADRTSASSAPKGRNGNSKRSGNQGSSKSAQLASNKNGSAAQRRASSSAAASPSKIRKSASSSIGIGSSNQSNRAGRGPAHKKRKTARPEVVSDQSDSHFPLQCMPVKPQPETKKMAATPSATRGAGDKLSHGASAKDPNALPTNMLKTIGRKRRWASLRKERPANMRQFGQWMQDVVDVSDPSIPWNVVDSNTSDDSTSTDSSGKPSLQRKQAAVVSKWSALLTKRPSEDKINDMNGWLISVLQCSCDSPPALTTTDASVGSDLSDVSNHQETVRNSGNKKNKDGDDTALDTQSEQHKTASDTTDTTSTKKEARASIEDNTEDNARAVNAMGDLLEAERRRRAGSDNSTGIPAEVTVKQSV